jgi:hypothetical protein
MRGFVSHDEVNSHPKPKRLFHYYFAARPWLCAGAPSETADYH